MHDDPYDALPALTDATRDPDATVRPVFPLFRLDRRGVGDLVTQLQEDLLACDLRRDQTLRSV